MADAVVTERVVEVDRTFNERVPSSDPSKVEWDLAVDLYEQRGNVIAKMILPYMNSANLDIYLDEDTLRISGRRQEEKETKDKYSTQRTHHILSFSRVVNLPKIVDVSRSSAEYKDGALVVTMPVPTYTKAAAVKVPIK